MTVKLSEEEAKKRLIDKTIEEESATGWQVEAREEENNMGDHDDLPTDKEEVQLRRLHKESQPLE
jgi:hypothetical protein